MHKKFYLPLFFVVGAFTGSTCFSASPKAEKPAPTKKVKPSGSKSSSVDMIASVGNQSITRFDLDARTKLILMMSGMPINDQTKSSLAAPVLKNMIEELVQLETAKKYKVAAKEKEVDATLKNMAKDWQMSFDQLKAKLKENGIPLASLRERVKAQISWNSFVRAAFSHTIHITDRDAHQHLQKQKENEAKDQYEIAEIFIRVDASQGAAAAEKQLRDVIQQTKNGGNFKVMAQQFSSSPSASRGGYLGWVTDDHAGASAFKALEPGQVSEPFRTNHGVYIFYVLDKKPAGQAALGDALITHKQVTIPVTEGFTPEQDPMLMAKFDEFAEAKSPSDFERIAREQNHKVITTSDVPIATLAHEFRTLPVGKMARPALTKEGLVLLMITEKKPGKRKEEATIDDIKAKLEEERLLQRAMTQLTQRIMSNHIKILAPQEFPTLNYGNTTVGAKKSSVETTKA